MKCTNAASDPRPTIIITQWFVYISINVEFISFIRYYLYVMIVIILIKFRIDGYSIATMFCIYFCVIFIILNLWINNELNLTEKICFWTCFRTDVMFHSMIKFGSHIIKIKNVITLWLDRAYIAFTVSFYFILCAVYC